ncbi:MAG: hypothetical protein QOG10_4706 [Kribbellaceae bacterium]|nr:hypothetical protein [Kribbellaceae bacterium]
MTGTAHLFQVEVIDKQADWDKVEAALVTWHASGEP